MEDDSGEAGRMEPAEDPTPIEEEDGPGSTPRVPAPPSVKATAAAASTRPPHMRIVVARQTQRRALAVAKPVVDIQV